MADLAPLPVVFGVPLADAEEDWPGRNQLFVSLLRHRQVVFLESPRRPGLRLPRMSRLANGALCVRNAYGLMALPHLWKLRPLAAWLDARLLDLCLTAAKLTPYVFWLEVPEPMYIRGLRPAVLVYDSMDPCFEPEGQAAHDARERYSVQRADLVVASAASLERRVRAFGAHDPVRLENAASQADLESPLTAAEARRALGVSGPVAAYLGTLDARVDIGLLSEVATRLPDWTFLIGGRVNAERAEEAAALGALANVVITGPVDTEHGRRVIAAADVCLIPFLEGDMNDGVNSVKMFSYLAFGKPVVGTNVEECRSNPLVLSASGAPAFARAIVAAGETGSAEARRAYAAANTWDARARRASELLDDWLAGARSGTRG